MKFISTFLLTLSICLGAKNIQAQNVSLYDAVGPTLISSHNTILDAYNACGQAKNYIIEINSSYAILGNEFVSGLTLGVRPTQVLSITIKLNSTASSKIFSRTLSSIPFITFNGARKVTIDGSNSGGSAGGLTFINNYSLYEPIFVIAGGSADIQIINCIFRSTSNTSTETGLIQIKDGTSTAGNRKINILNNIFDGTSATNFYQAAITSSSPINLPENTDINIRGNTFSNYTNNASKPLAQTMR